MSQGGLPVRYDLLKDPSTPLICTTVKRRSQNIHTLADPSVQELNEARQGYFFNAGPYL